MRPLITVGHGTATAEELAQLIGGVAIKSLIDVRAFPGSRRHPQFRREEMERWVPDLSGGAYRWEPALGGFRKGRSDSLNVALRHPSFRAYADYMETGFFRVALGEVLEEAAFSNVAIMCSETLWWRCHRRLISDAAMLVHGTEVRHLMHDGTPRPHVPTPGVRVTAEGTLRYDKLSDADPTRTAEGEARATLRAPLLEKGREDEEEAL